MKREQFCLVALAATLIGLLSAAPGPALAQEQKAPEQKDSRMASSQWGGNYFPNVELTSSKGEKVRFFDDLVGDGGLFSADEFVTSLFFF